MLLEHGVDVESRDQFGNTAMNVAAGEGNAAAVEILLDYGADIESGARFQNPPLQSAARHGDRATMSLLLDRGANVGDLYWTEASLRLLIDERRSGSTATTAAGS